VTRYLLDTNIISNVVKPQPSETLLSWMSAQRDEDLFISSLTVAEIRRGILEKPCGRKRDALDLWFAGSDGPQARGDVARHVGAARLAGVAGFSQRNFVFPVKTVGVLTNPKRPKRSTIELLLSDWTSATIGKPLSFNFDTRAVEMC
jgi:hypothetical protein